MPSLVAGIAILVFGLTLLGDQAGVVELRFAALAPLVCAIIGTILLAAGLSRRE